MSVAQLLTEFGARVKRVRSGLDIGFADDSVPLKLREHGGVWYSVSLNGSVRDRLSASIQSGSSLIAGANGELPFEDRQFEVVVLNGEVITPELVREAHRVLRPAGLLFFSVTEKSGKNPGFTQKDLFDRFLKHGFNLIGLRRPAWWWFGRHGHDLTVCAERKNWRVHGPLSGCATLPLTPFGKAPR